MTKLCLAIFCVFLSTNQVLSQILGPIEPPRNFLGQFPPSYPMVEPPYPIPSPTPTSTTIITDCTPSTCKNLANTLQLMIVANLLQNTNGGSDLALQMAAPLINELFNSPTLSCGCANPFANAILPPSAISPNIASNVLANGISPNLISSLLSSTNLASSLIPPNLVASLGNSANIISNLGNSPNLISSLGISPNLISGLGNNPNLVSTLVSAIAGGGPGVLNYF